MKKEKLIILSTILVVGLSPIQGLAAECEGTGDEISAIEAVNAVNDPVASAQVNLKAEVKENFVFPIYASIKNLDTEDIYQLSLLPENNYHENCNVKPGNYRVIEIYSAEDNTGTYSFDYPDDFTVLENGSVDLKTTILEPSVSSGNAESDNVPLPQNIQYSSDFQVIHKGSGTGIVSINGTQQEKYDLVIKVGKSGIPGSASVLYSLDNGQTWSEETPLPLRGSIELFKTDKDGSNKDTGLTACFYADSVINGSSFIKDDTYTSYIPDPETEVIIEHTGDSSIDMTITPNEESLQLYDILNSNKISLVINVLKSGKAGEAVIEISKDNGKTYSKEMYLPKDGKIIFEDLCITLNFEKSNIYPLKEKDVYKAYPYHKSYIRAYILAFILFTIAGVIYILFSVTMKSMLPTADDWEIMEYVPVKNKKRNKRKKPNE